MTTTNTAPPEGTRFCDLSAKPAAEAALLVTELLESVGLPFLMPDGTWVYPDL